MLEARHEPSITAGERAAPFARRLREIRSRLGVEQLNLVVAGLGCSLAAISYWENGRRIRSPLLFAKLAAALADLGASSDDLASLRSIWVAEQWGAQGAPAVSSGYDPVADLIAPLPAANR